MLLRFLDFHKRDFHDEVTVLVISCPTKIFHRFFLTTSALFILFSSDIDLEKHFFA